MPGQSNSAVFIGAAENPAAAPSDKLQSSPALQASRIPVESLVLNLCWKPEEAGLVASQDGSGSIGSSSREDEFACT